MKNTLTPGRRQKLWPLLPLLVTLLACTLSAPADDSATTTPAMAGLPTLVASTPVEPDSPPPTSTATASPTATSKPAAATQPQPTPPPQTSNYDKFALWTDGPHLRGVNIYQRRVYPELDGNSFGPGPVGPPFAEIDFTTLASLGANVVHISHPGLFSENAPYELDEELQTNLDQLIDWINAADMFAVIGFRTGPGRSEFTFFHGEESSWFDESYINEQVWVDAAAQGAWAEMWRYTAARYASHPAVVGYELMIEPNSNEVWLDEWEPERFYADYAGSLFDWNPLAAQISAAVRTVDAETPILIGGMAYSSAAWLPYVEPTGDPRTVYVVHQYAPFAYTHQEPGSSEFTFPGQVDNDGDGQPEPFDISWLLALFDQINLFRIRTGAPVAVSEYGLVRWAADGPAFLVQQQNLMDQLGLNYAIWSWSSSWGLTQGYDGFIYRFGPDPDNHRVIPNNELTVALRVAWLQNEKRPSTVE